LVIQILFVSLLKKIEEKIMCVLVYPKNEAQKSALTSFLEERDIDFDYEEPRATPNEYLKLLENRIDEIKCNPENAGSSFNDFDKKMRAKYGF